MEDDALFNLSGEVLSSSLAVLIFVEQSLVVCWALIALCRAAVISLDLNLLQCNM